MKNKINIICKAERKPFTIIGYENEKGEKKYFLTCGNLRLEEEHDNFKEVEKEIKKKTWKAISLLVEQFVNYMLIEQKK